MFDARSNNHGFTLVEIIIVITIIAILSTISFNYYALYASISRDTKRINDISILSSLTSKGLIKGININSFIETNSNTLNNPYIAGKILNTGINYNAGTINYKALSISSDNLTDPDGNKYVIGITNIYNSYEITASLEDYRFPGRTAAIKGNYTPRKSIETRVNISSGNGTNVIYVFDNSLLQEGDTIRTNGAYPVTTKINKLSYLHNLGNRLTFNSIIPNDATYIELAFDETPGLIADKNNSSNIITNGSNFVAY